MTTEQFVLDIPGWPGSEPVAGNPINPDPCQTCGRPATREVRRFVAYRRRQVLAAWAFACEEHATQVADSIAANAEVRTVYGWSLERVAP